MTPRFSSQKHNYPLKKSSMESLNFTKGYNKVTPSEESQNSPPQINQKINNRRKIIAISLIVFTTLVVASLVAALIQQSTAKDPESPSDQTLAASNSAKSLKIVCSYTLHPDSCISSITPLNDPPANNPLAFLNISIQVGLREIKNLTSLPQNLFDSKADPALKDCVDLFDDSASQLVKSSESISAGEQALTEMEVSDIQTWISAAMTDGESCLDGLDEMGSTGVDELRLRVKKSQEYMSNSLAILNNRQSIDKKMGLMMP